MLIQAFLLSGITVLQGAAYLWRYAGFFEAIAYRSTNSGNALQRQSAYIGQIGSK
ncbi:MAG: hypothetical protein WC856_27795 [Methylococcaceae bacterium]